MLSSVEKLLKFFKLEKERGYDNRAVVGGLDKILPAWESEARSNHVEDEIIQEILDVLRAYPDQDPAQRSETLTQLIVRLEQAAKTDPIERFGISSAAPAGGDPEKEPTRQAYQPNRQPVIASKQQSPRRHPREDQVDYSGSQTRQTSPKTSTPDQSGLNAPVRVLQGVGDRLSQTLSSLGLNTLEDLLFYFPRRYDDYSQLKPINRLEYGEETTVLGTVQNMFSRPVRGGKLQLTEAVVGDGTGFLRVTWFNQPWLSGRYSAGTQVVLAGKVEQYLGRPTMSNPEIEPVEQEHLHTNRIVPVYPLTSGLTQKNLRRIMYQTITYWAPRVPDYLPNHVRNAVKLIPLTNALINVHFPESQDMLDVARWRLAFDEIFLLQLGVLRQKHTWQTAQAQVFEVTQEWLDQQINRLPYPLTSAQNRVLGEIRADLVSGQPMNRLIQGDVGSGKTVIAALAILMVVQNGAQAAVMAPTSILAEQHYRNLTQLLTQPVSDDTPPLHAEEIRLLIGDTSEAEKEEIRQGLENGSVKLVIGTHALLESPVQFQRLQLAVIDEQHRFGVAQRSTLRAKGDNPHLLVMTATPIPRSLALTVYGDLDLSVIDEMPPGRQPVDTHVLNPVERERAYQLDPLSGLRTGPRLSSFIRWSSKTEKRMTCQKTKTRPASLAVEEHQRLQKNIFPKLKVRPATRTFET